MEQTRNKTDIAFTVSGRLAVSCAVAYMALPTILFLLGWVRPLFSVPAAAAVAAAAVLLSATIPAPTLHFTRRQMAIYLCVLVLSLLWLLAGGMTGITSQHADFVVRNPIYETLIRCDWPLVDAGGRPFIYYLAFWLPPALACKCLSCSDIFIINYVLTAWTGLGLALTLTVLWSKFRTATLLFLLLLIFQGPLDGIVRWGLHLFHLQGPLAHELYLTVLAFFGGVPPTMQLHYTFHHTTLLWLFLRNPPPPRVHNPPPPPHPFAMDLSRYQEHYSLSYRLKRYGWYIVNRTLFRLMVTNAMKVPRNLLLRLFGARIPLASLVYPSSKIWAPWNLSVGEYACIGPDTEIYNKAPITIGNHAVISQGAFLCTASHDISDPAHSLISAPITVEDQAWVAAQAFVGMGVTVGRGAVVGARSAVFRDVAPWTVVGGNPARFIKQRTLR